MCCASRSTRAIPLAVQPTVLSRTFLIALPCFAFLWVASVSFAQSKPDTGWPNYGNDGGGTRYSPVAQIDRRNVEQLKAAWTYRTGALPHDPELDKKAAFEATPILIDGKLFLSTPYDHVIALNPETGSKLWEFDPKLELPYGSSEGAFRGVTCLGETVT